MEVVDLLLRAGAEPETATAQGATCLMPAAAGGHADIVTRLREAGADIERLASGWNAAGLAKAGGHDAIVALLAPSTPRMGHEELAEGP